MDPENWSGKRPRLNKATGVLPPSVDRGWGTIHDHKKRLKKVRREGQNSAAYTGSQTQ